MMRINGPAVLPEAIVLESEATCPGENLKSSAKELDRFVKDNVSPPDGSPPQGKEAKPFQGFQERRVEFLQTLRRLHGRGAKLDFILNPTLLMADFKEAGKAALFLEAFRAIDAPGRVDGVNPEEGFFFQEGDLSPEAFLREQAAFFLEKDPRLLERKEKQVKVLVTTLHVQVKKNTVRLILWDWLEGRPFFEKIYPNLPHDPKLKKQVAQEISRALKNHFRFYPSPAHLKLISGLSPEKERSLRETELFHLNHPRGWSEQNIREAQRSWRRLAKDFRVELIGTPFREDVDREEGRNRLLFRPLQLELKPWELRKNRYLPIEVRGFLEGIFFEPPSPRKARRLGKETRLQGPVTELYRDKYGNVILPLPGEEVLTGKSMFLGFNVTPRFPLAKSAAEAQEAHTVGVDLSAFGFGDHPHLLTGLPIAPIHSPTEKNPYYLYSTLEPDATAQAQEIYEAIARGAAEVEKAFGIAAGKRIHHVFFVPSERWNASVRVANPETLFIWDEMFPAIREGGAAYVVAHEAYHSLDLQFRFSTHPRFLRFFENLIEAHDHDLFRFINESQFLGKDGGHSQDNVFELFASLLNTLNAPDWREKMEQACPRTRGLYYHALLALREAFEERYAPMRRTPIHNLVLERLAALNALADAAKSPYPPLEDLVMLPASKMLERGAHPVEVVKVKDLKKRIAHSRDPILVYVFTEENREPTPAVQAMARHFKSQARFIAVDYREIIETKLFKTIFKESLSAPEVYLFYRRQIIYRGEFYTPKVQQETIQELNNLIGVPLEIKNKI